MRDRQGERRAETHAQVEEVIDRVTDMIRTNREHLARSRDLIKRIRAMLASYQGASNGRRKVE